MGENIFSFLLRYHFVFTEIPNPQMKILPDTQQNTQNSVSSVLETRSKNRGKKLPYHELISFENDFKNTVYAMQILAPRITCICGCYATVKR